MHKKPDLEYWAFKVVVCQQTGTGQQSKQLHRLGRNKLVWGRKAVEGSRAYCLHCLTAKAQHIVLGCHSPRLNISSHYHNSGNVYNIKRISRLRSGVGCEDDRNHFVVMILSILQDIWVAVRGVGVGDVKRISLDFGGGLNQR
jgi:hypothetical protein